MLSEAEKDEVEEWSGGMLGMGGSKRSHLKSRIGMHDCKERPRGRRKLPTLNGLRLAVLTETVDGDGYDDDGTNNDFLDIGGPAHLLGAIPKNGHDQRSDQ